MHLVGFYFTLPTLMMHGQAQIKCTWLPSFRHTSEFHTAVLRLLRCYVILCYVMLCYVMLLYVFYVALCSPLFFSFCFCHSCCVSTVYIPYSSYRHVPVQLKLTLQQPIKAQTGSKGIALIFHLGARWGWSGERHAPAALPPVNRPVTRCTRGWVSRTAGLHGCGKSSPHRDSIPRVAIPTEPSRPAHFVTF